ncbi:predicted protein, partial [Nematostella vectensis]
PSVSCLGPIHFIVYASAIFNIINQHLPNAHGYADNTDLPRRQAVGNRGMHI